MRDGFHGPRQNGSQAPREKGTAVDRKVAHRAESLTRRLHPRPEGAKPTSHRAVHDGVADAHDHTAQNIRVHVDVRHHRFPERLRELCRHRRGVGVAHGARHRHTRVHAPLSRIELQRLGTAYWSVVAIAIVFTLARFSEAFLLLKAQSVGLPVMLVPAVMVVMNLVYALAAYPAGVLSDNGNRMRVLVIGLAFLVIADLVLALSSGVAGVMIGVGLWGLHMGFTQGLLTTLIADTAPAELRGTAFGMYNLLTGLALLAASVIAGALWDWIGPQATFITGAAFTAFALVGFVLLHARKSGRETLSR